MNAVTLMSRDRAATTAEAGGGDGLLDTRVRLTHRSLAIVIASILLLGSTVSGETRETKSECVNPTGGPEPSDGVITEDFCGRIAAYVTLRGELQEDLPALRVTDDVAAVRHTVRALAERIRSTHHRPSEGKIFTPRISDQFRTRLRLIVTDDTCATIMTDNPGRLSRPVSQDYPEGKPRSTTPATILAIFPRLPPDIEYRFVGRDLILLDTRANIVIDRVVDAVCCGDASRELT